VGKDGFTPKEQADLLGYTKISELLAKQEAITPVEPAAKTTEAVQPATPPLVSANLPTPPGADPWVEVATFEGDKSLNTKTFTVSPGWKLLWETKPVNKDESSIIIYICNPDGKAVAVCASGSGTTQDEYLPKQTGTFYLEIKTTQPYSIRVLDKVNLK
jgi:hypothetical protein